MEDRYNYRVSRAEEPKQQEPQPQPQQQEQQQEQDEGIELEEAIELLKKHQLECEEDGRYVEAEMAMNRIKELKRQLEQQNKEDISMRHQGDLTELEETHIAEFNEFNQDWDKRMNEFQQHSAQLLASLDEKHEQQYQDKRKRLEDNMPDLFKPSTSLNELHAQHKNLAKQKNYQQAHQIQIKANKLEEKERSKYNQGLDHKIDVQLKKLVKQQDMEVESLRKRIIAGENEQKKQRALDLEKMFQRYNNVKKEMENNHKKEINYMNKGNGSVFNPNISKMSNRSYKSSANGIKASGQKKRPSDVSRR